MNRETSRLAAAAALSLLVLAGGACRREEAAAPQLTPSVRDFPRRVPADPPTPDWAKDTRRPGPKPGSEYIDAPQSPAHEWAVSLHQRRNQVDAAPPGWKPEARGRKVRLTLRLKSPRMRAGEFPSYRAELQNVGTQTIRFSQSWTFWRAPHAVDPSNRIVVTGPDGRPVRRDYWPECPHVRDYSGVIRLPGMEKMTRDQQAEAVRRHVESKYPSDPARVAVHSGDIDVVLNPGETLFTKGWKPLKDPMERCEMSDEAFLQRTGDDLEYRVLDQFLFERPGKYRIKLVWDNKPSRPSSEEDIQFMISRGVSREDVLRMDREHAAKRFGIVESNEVEVEVLP